jgi:hypothetical protein
MKIRCVPAFILLAVAGCGYSVEGVVQFQGKPADGAQVTLEDDTTVTDGDGKFTFSFARPGSRQLTAELDLYENGSVAVHDFIQVAETSNNVTLQLPEPVVLSLVEATTGTVAVQWTRSSSPDFRKYELYRYLSNGTGALLHARSNVDEVSYIDEGEIASGDMPLPLNTDFFYRVSVLDDVGLISDSNVLRVHVPQWDTDVFSKRYKLEEKSQLLGEEDVGGICSDGSALWVAYSAATGGKDDPINVWIARYDIATWTISSQIAWNDGIGSPIGIGCDGAGIWVNYNAKGVTRLERRDATTGEVTKTYVGDSYYHDFDFDGENLLALSQFNRIDVLNPETGVISRICKTPFQPSTASGIAIRDGEWWISAWTHNELAILDPKDGAHIGLVTTGVSIEDWRGPGLFMAFLGDDIAIVRNSTIYIYRIVPE